MTPLRGSLFRGIAGRLPPSCLIVDAPPASAVRGSALKRLIQRERRVASRGLPVPALAPAELVGRAPRLAVRGPGEGQPVEDRIERVAREAFGFEKLRPGQREAIESVLAGRDTLVVMSTGSGKSAVYQIAGLLIEGATVVVSPLIALQRDQVDDLGERAAGGAAQINSSLPASERERAFAELAEDALEFLFLAPEQLANDEVLAELAVAHTSLLVIDEAHCISEWGHDFRPEYLRVGAAAEALGRPTILALTATAAPPVRAEIAERLGLRDPSVLVRGFDRPNIRLAVERFHGDRGAERKARALLDAVEAARKPGIVYVATRRHAEEVAASLCERGVSAASYHAGMKSGERERVQERFMESELEAVVATTAFGMGIDKADVRWVFHSEISESLDAYYQEIGRAGRDGEPAQATLFYRTEDLGLRRFFSAGGHVEVDEIAQVLEAITGANGAVEPAAIQDATELSETRLASALARLEEAGAVRVLPSGAVEAGCVDDTAATVRAAAEEAEKRRVLDRSRVDMMRGYAEADGCRREFVLSYFSEPFAPPCGNCDNCEDGRGEATRGARPFAVGDRVAHSQWGEGVVQRYDDDAVVVLFDEVGYKTLALDVLLERGLLERA